jgi:hypothetical protein
VRKELVLILVLLLGGLLIAYRWAGNSPLAMFTARGVTKVDDATPLTIQGAAGPARQPIPNTGRAAVKKTINGDAATVFLPLTPTVSVPEKAPATECCDKPQLPFPTPETLKKGTTKAEILAVYGAPSMDIAGTREGSVLENYYYLNPEKNRLTVAYLQNGLLVSVQAFSSPYFNLQSPIGTIPNTKQ